MSCIVDFDAQATALLNKILTEHNDVMNLRQWQWEPAARDCEKWQLRWEAQVGEEEGGCHASERGQARYESHLSLRLEVMPVASSWLLAAQALAYK